MCTCRSVCLLMSKEFCLRADVGNDTPRGEDNLLHLFLPSQVEKKIKVKLEDDGLLINTGIGSYTVDMKRIEVAISVDGQWADFFGT